MTMKQEVKSENSSFRDPSGYIARISNKLYRIVNHSYQQEYDFLIKSGLHHKLVSEKLLIPVEETNENLGMASAYKVLKPEVIPFISYPYEWSFSQLKDAALLTLKIQKIALSYGMSLKDASAYNVQFHNGKPIFIDTLSFEIAQKDKPWVAYRQFCQHFLAPLAVMSQVDIGLGKLLRSNIDGLPLDLASKLLPYRSRLSFSNLVHIHLHAKSQKHYESKNVAIKEMKLKGPGVLGLVNNLENAIRKISWKPQDTEWADYYNDTNYTDRAFDHKIQVIDKFIKKTSPKNVWDLGANDGTFSKLAANQGIMTVSFDIDPAAVEKNYLATKKDKSRCLLPLVMDLADPSPGIGWQNCERRSLTDRGPCDVALALALMHHLAISNNVPFEKIAEYFASICHRLVIEFVPKDDSQIRRLLVSREDIFGNYTRDNFVAQFKKFFKIIESEPIIETGREVFLMEKM
ncbi:MAG: hypothetical protein BWY68_00622 [bacterium ADurb.Bin400]|nr:MAG: hypothetical protein BWY68_00622 [bacterium ADurb.Bin400]